MFAEVWLCQKAVDTVTCEPRASDSLSVSGHRQLQLAAPNALWISAFEASAGRMTYLSIALSTDRGRTSASQANVRGCTWALGRLHS